MAKCFIIQPFDRGKYDQRFTDTFEPAIKNANLIPYRVDRDPAATVLIDEIERNIQESDLCFAEITTDNPNVWYELGYAYANGKEVVMVCSNERTTPFPFDIRHKNIITYNTGSRSDFDRLVKKITERAIALVEKDLSLKKISYKPLLPTEGLEPHEITMLATLIKNQLSYDNSYPIRFLIDDMGKAGYNQLATNLAIRTLEIKKLISVFSAEDFNGSYTACRLTQAGEQWMIDNRKSFELGKSIKPTPKNTKDDPDDLPF